MRLVRMASRVQPEPPALPESLGKPAKKASRALLAPKVSKD